MQKGSSISSALAAMGVAFAKALEQSDPMVPGRLRMEGQKIHQYLISNGQQDVAELITPFLRCLRDPEFFDQGGAGERDDSAVKSLPL